MRVDVDTLKVVSNLGCDSDRHGCKAFTESMHVVATRSDSSNAKKLRSSSLVKELLALCVCVCFFE